ncbi:ABC transporter permease [Anaerosporobacter faecicola]|uniref:ABC transporter permease n=1 Tax=Anaerosporobacter faecicola TaxID=2718714 RepID=UPI00143C8534|nr:ABC transporter permease [Anaerosporobacter faecicola]
MRIKAITKRIILQMFHDKRTLALILFAPILVLTLIYFILNSENKEYTIGIIQAPEGVVQTLQDQTDYTINIKEIAPDAIENALNEETIDAAIDASSDSVTLYLLGVDSSVSSRIQQLVKRAFEQQVQAPASHSMHFEIHYEVGDATSSLFDKFGTQLIGIIVYFFVFLIAGIQFLSERTSGTLEKLLSTPMRRYEIIMGYLAGFGIIAILQSSLITFFVVYVLGLPSHGNIWLVLLITLLTAIHALSLGILLSTIANSEFQMVQFIPIIILPQIFLCGLFQISGLFSKFGYIMPLHYTSHAMIEVMMKGNGLSSIKFDLLYFTVSLLFFIWLNMQLLKKQRKL